MRLIVLSGDIAMNLGTVKHPFLMCKKAVARLHRSLTCTSCKSLCHIGENCGNVKNQDFINIKRVGGGYIWNCPLCFGLRQQPQTILLNNTKDAPEGSYYVTFKRQLEDGGKDSLQVAHVNVKGIITRNKLMELTYCLTKLELIS